MNVTPIGVWGGYPAAGEATSSFLIEQDGFHCLVDCGSGVLSTLQKMLKVEELDAVIISHYHADHIADVGTLQFARMIKKQTGSKIGLLPIYGHRHDEAGFENLTFKDLTEAREIGEDQAVEVGPWTVSFCRTVHPVYCLAIKFESKGKRLVLTADTGWREELVSFASEADLLISEANLYEKHVGQVEGHMSGSQAGELAAKAGARRLLLTHLPQYGELTEILTAAKSAYGGEAAFAEAGKTIHI